MRHDSGRELIARAIILRDECLLVNRSHHRKSDRTYFALPGGHVDPGESCVAALRRELTEELGATITVGELCFVSESVYAGRHPEDSTRHELVLYFRAELRHQLRELDGVIISPEAGKSFRWLKRGDWAEANLVPTSVKEFLLRNGQDRGSPRYAFDDATTATPQDTDGSANGG